MSEQEPRPSESPKHRRRLAFGVVGLTSLVSAAYFGLATEIAHALAVIGLGSILHALIIPVIDRLFKE